MRSLAICASLFVAIIPVRNLADVTFHVTSLDDAGPGSLRAAFQQSAATTGTNTILVETGGTARLSAPLPRVSTPMNILGVADQPFRLTYTGTNSLLQIARGPLILSNLVISGCVITSGPVISNIADLRIYASTFEGNQVFSNQNGGVIYSAGTLLLNTCVFSNNLLVGTPGEIRTDWGAATTLPVLGGAVYARSLEANHCTFFQNTARGGIGGKHYTPYSFFAQDPAGKATGGALAIVGNAATNNYLVDCTFLSNTAEGGTPGGAGWGGAVMLDSCAIALTNCILSRNMARGIDGGYQNKASAQWGGDGFAGGAFLSWSDVSFLNCVLTENQVVGGAGVPDQGVPPGHAIGGGLMLFGPPVVLGNTIIRSNIASAAPDIAGPVRSKGSNTVGNVAASCGFVESDDVPNKPLSTKTPQFEWIQTNIFSARMIAPGSDGDVYCAGTGLDPHSANQWLIHLDRFGNVLWSDDLGYLGDAWEFRSLLVSEEDQVLIYYHTQYGDYRLSRFSDGHYAKDTTEPLLSAIRNGTAVATLTFTNDPPWTVITKLRGHRVDKNSTLDLAFTPALRGTPSQVLDGAGNWYIQADLASSSTFPGSQIELPPSFIIKINRDTKLEWVFQLPAPRPQNWGSSQLFLLRNSLLSSAPGEEPDGSPRYVLRWIDSGGDELMSQTFTNASFGLALADPRRDLIYCRDFDFDSNIFESISRSPASAYGFDGVLAQRSGDAAVNWFVRIFGPTVFYAWALDSDGNLIISGDIRANDFWPYLYAGFQNDRAFVPVYYGTHFLAKLNTTSSGAPRLYSQKTSTGLDLLWPTNSNARLETTTTLSSNPQWKSTPDPTQAGDYFKASTKKDSPTQFFHLRSDPVP